MTSIAPHACLKLNSFMRILSAKHTVETDYDGNRRSFDVLRAPDGSSFTVIECCDNGATGSGPTLEVALCNAWNRIIFGGKPRIPNGEQAMRTLLWNGPHRVLIDTDTATTSHEAQEDHNIWPEVIFLRRDGWMLGAPSHLEPNAVSLWRESWVAFIRRGDTEFTPISEYRPR